MSDAVEIVLALIGLAVVVGGAYGLAYWAHRAQTDRSAIVGLYLLFGIPGALLVLIGLAFLVNGNERGFLWLAIGLGLGLPLLRPVRRAFARVMPMEAGSAIDMTGLCIVLGILGLLVVSFALDPEPAEIGGEVSVPALAAQFLAEIALAYVAVGIFISRGWRAANERLGLTLPSPKVVGSAIGFVVVAFVIIGIGGGLTAWLQPDVSDKISDATEEITANVTNPIGAIFFGLGAGLGEELLIRGAVQPRYGLLVSSLFFALLHNQYGVSFVLVSVFLVGLLLGIERKYLGTTASIITHAVFNTTVVLLNS